MFVLFVNTFDSKFKTIDLSLISNNPPSHLRIRFSSSNTWFFFFFFASNPETKPANACMPLPPLPQNPNPFSLDSIHKLLRCQVKPQESHISDKSLQALCFSGRLTEAIAILCGTESQLDPKTYSLLLQECIFRKDYKKGKIIHAHIIITGYVLNQYMKTKLLILYAKSGDLQTAHNLFDEMLERSIVSWNAMIAGYVQRGLEEAALSLYIEMRQNGFIPDQYTFASVLKACAGLASLEHGRQAHGVMIKCKISDNVVINSALVDMYFKCSSLCDGQKVFDKSVTRNVITWTGLISGYSQHGKVVKVFKSFDRMKIEGFRPNYVTFLSVLTACSYGGLVNEGWKYFNEMTRDYGIEPRGQHYAAMVDLLGRSGKLRYAYELVMNLKSPCKEHPVIWGALLGACRTHGDIDLMKNVAEKYFGLESGNVGKYVVLSNAYAFSGLWDNAEEVRAVMEEAGMVKEPGYSRIEVQREGHFFIKGDKTHKRSDEIHEMVRALTTILKDDVHIQYPILRVSQIK